MLQQALNRHPCIAVPPETAFFTFLGLSCRHQRKHLQRVNADLLIDLPAPSKKIAESAEGRELYEMMAQQYLGRLGRAGITHFGEKTPEHLRRLGLIKQLFPEAKIILIYRDGRDVACSLKKLPWMSGDLYVNFWLWLHYYQLQTKAVALRDPNLICVKYEELVTNPDQEFRKILEFLALPHDPQVAGGFGNREGVPLWETSWKGQALERVTSRRIGLWRNELSIRQIRVLERWGKNALRGLGYELTTCGEYRLPFWFFPELFWKSALWLSWRPDYARGRELFLHQAGRHRP